MAEEQATNNFRFSDNLYWGFLVDENEDDRRLWDCLNIIEHESERAEIGVDHYGFAHYGFTQPFFEAVAFSTDGKQRQEFESRHDALAWAFATADLPIPFLQQEINIAIDQLGDRDTAEACQFLFNKLVKKIREAV